MFDQSLSCNDKMFFKLVKDACLMDTISGETALDIAAYWFLPALSTHSMIDMFLHHLVLGLLEAKERCRNEILKQLKSANTWASASLTVFIVALLLTVNRASLQQASKAYQMHQV